MRIQGVNEVVVDAGPERIWALLQDPYRIPEYMKSVKDVRTDGAELEQVGAARTCLVEMEGKQGEVVERCVELVPHQRLSHVLERDTLGFSRFFDDFGFSWVLEPRPDGRTVVRIEGFYREKGVVSKAMNLFVMKRKLSALRQRILQDLKVVVEAPSDASDARPDRPAAVV